MRCDTMPCCKLPSLLAAVISLAVVQSSADAQLPRSGSHSLTSGTTYASGRSIFGSPFANQPFSISGMTGGSLSGTYPPYSGGLEGFGVRNNIPCQGGGIGGLGLVAPGWWGVGWGPGFNYWNPGFGYYQSTTWGWNSGWNNGWIGPNLWQGGWGWNPWNGYGPFWNSGFVWDWGFLGGVENIVRTGNARFGPARPVRHQRAARIDNGAPLIPDAGGLNAVAPNRPGMAAAKPNLPDFVRVAESAEAVVLPRREASSPDRLQTANRLARNGLFDEAIDRYEAYARQNPQDSVALIRIAQLHALSDRPELALEAFDRAEERCGDRFTAILKSVKWSDIADSVASDKLTERFARWSEDPSLTGIEKLKASFAGAELPAVAQLP